MEGTTKNMSIPYYTQPINIKKHCIGTKTNTKMDTVGDDWDEEIVIQEVDLLKEYEDIFPRTLSKMKGITRDLGEMKIQLKPNAKLVKKRQYRLKPKYKENVC